MKHPLDVVRVGAWNSLELVKFEINETEIETLGIGMKIMWMELKFLAMAKQLYEWFSPSARPFFTPSLCS